MFRFVLLCGLACLASAQDGLTVIPEVTESFIPTPPLETEAPEEDVSTPYVYIQTEAEGDVKTPEFTGVTGGDETDPITTEFPNPPTTFITTERIPDLTTEEPTTAEREEETEPPNPQTERYTAAGISTQLPIEMRQPSIKVHPRNVTVPKDSYAKFFCSATGSPSPHLVIVRADSNYVIPEFAKNAVSKGEESLPEVQQTIGPITEANEGWYECIAANFWGTVKSRAYLRVMDLCADVNCKPPKTCVQDYDNATASCECPQLLCELNYDPVCGADCQVHFNPCVWNQTSCTNDYDSSSIIAKKTCPPITEPEVTLIGDSAEIDEGGRFVLSASVGGYPEPTVEWQKVDDDGNFLESVGKGLELALETLTLAMSGKYVAKATNCQTKHVYTRSVQLDVIPLPEPTPAAEKEPINACSIFGDPHIVTFDKHTLHFAGDCTYLLAMDCVSFSWFVYGSFTPCGAGTCLEEVTVFINHNPFTLARGWIIFVNGEKYEYIQGTEFEVGAMSWTFDGMILSGRNDDLGLSLSYDGFTSLLIGVDESRTSPLCGVCGNNDREKGNEHEQYTKLEDKLIDSLESNVYVNNWKIDREKMCVLPDNVEFNPDEPCGTDYGKSREAINACQSIVENAALQRCASKVDLKFYYNSCLYDYCYMSLLREDEDPFAKPSPTIAPECTVARTYAAHCEMEGVDMRGWDVYMKCDVADTQDAIISIACYQENLPFIRFK